jgi:hypothetical protein
MHSQVGFQGWYLGSRVHRQQRNRPPTLPGASVRASSKLMHRPRCMPCHTHAGPLPPAWAGMPELQYLYLSSNK